MMQTNTWENDTHKITCPIYKQVIDSILIEKMSPMKKTFQLFCVKANYKQVTDKELISSQLQSEIVAMLEKHQNGFTYLNIPDIDFSFEEVIQQRLFAGEATMIEKFMLQKYHFKNKFIPDAETLCFDDSEELVLESAWNNQYGFFFDQIRRYQACGADCIFEKIKVHNKLEGIFCFDLKKLKLTPEMKQQIFSEFKFKFIGCNSTDCKILHEVYNTFFGVKIVKSEYDETGHKGVNYTVDPKWNTWLQFVLDYNKVKFVELPECEHECDFD
jgi:hypothetical protein